MWVQILPDLLYRWVVLVMTLISQDPLYYLSKAEDMLDKASPGVASGFSESVREGYAHAERLGRSYVRLAEVLLKANRSGSEEA
jgi:hypothetical protein